MSLKSSGRACQRREAVAFFAGAPVLRRFALMISMGAFLVGCGGGGSTSNPPVGAQSAPAAQAAVASTSATSGSVQVTLAFAPVAVKTASALPTEAVTYTITIQDALTGVPVVDPVEVTAGDQPRTVEVPGVPPGAMNVSVSGRSATDAFVGASEQTVVVAAGAASAVTVSSLFQPGPTRELGLVSISTNGVQSNASSFFPYISSDGRYVCFGTAASTLTGASDGLARTCVRDRALGTLTVIPLSSTFLNGVQQSMVSNDGRTVMMAGGGVALWSASTGRSRTVSRGGSSPTMTSDGVRLFYGKADASGVRRLFTGLTSDVDDTVHQQVGAFVLSTRNISCSANGNRVAFVEAVANTPSLQATVFDRSAGRIVRIATSAAPLGLSLSADGTRLAFADGTAIRSVNVDTLAVEIEVPSAAQPSISSDGGQMAFRSLRGDLVANDENFRFDVFVWSRLTNAFSRVNVAADGTSVDGDGQEIAMASNGTRVAFRSTDSLLVPGDSNGLDDIFTASVPTPGLLYVSTGDGIVRYNNTLLGTRTGTVIFTAPAGLAVGPISLNPSTSQLYAALNAGSAAKAIVRIDSPHKISSPTTAVTVLTPTGATGAFMDLWADTTSTLVIASTNTGHVVRGRTSTISQSLEREGVFPAATMREGIFLDPRRRDLYVGTSVQGVYSVQVFNADASTPVVLRELKGSTTALGPLFDIELDASQRGVAGANASRLVAFTGPTNSLVNNRVSLFATSGSTTAFSDTAPRSQLGGPATLLGTTLLADTDAEWRQMLVDRVTGALYVASPGEKATLVFRGLVNGDVAPVISIGEKARGVALDRTR